MEANIEKAAYALSQADAILVLTGTNTDHIRSQTRVYKILSYKRRNRPANLLPVHFVLLLLIHDKKQEGVVKAGGGNTVCSGIETLGQANS